ncbi:MAG: hypothetical protein PHV30_03540 [Candidatus Margulisbacteria bacterium]|nr:hypothetical protein [Candidatus Margulisiibacteriota bacterium]
MNLKALIRIIVVGLLMSTIFAQSLVETGYLRNKYGRPITAVVPMQYKIYTTGNGGTPVWDSGVMTVTVNEGLYTAILGNTNNPINETVLTSSGNYYMEHWVNGGALNKREMLADNVRAILANKAMLADKAVTADEALAIDWKNIRNKPIDFGEGGLVINTTNYAASSSTSNTSLTSDYSITASYAFFAGTANVALWAQGSGLSALANTANYAITTNFSFSTYHSVTADISLTANYIEWDKIGNKPQFTTAGTLMDFSRQAQTANIAVWAQSSGLSVLASTANIALTANYIDWNRIGNKPQVATQGTTIDYAKLSQTANVALWAQSSGLSALASTASFAYKATTSDVLSNMNISQFVNNTGYLTTYNETDPLVKGYAKNKDENQLIVGTSNYAALANTALTANYTITASLAFNTYHASTADISLTTNYIEWDKIGNKPQLVTQGTNMDYVKMADTANSAQALSSSSDAIIIGDSDSNGSGDIVIKTGNNERIKILNSGNVGVGVANPSSKLQVNGAIATPVSNINNDYPLTAQDSVVLIDSSVIQRTVTLPVPTGITGRSYTIKKIDPSLNAVEIKSQSNELIDGNNRYYLTAQYEYVILVSNGANWTIAGNN